MHRERNPVRGVSSAQPPSEGGVEPFAARLVKHGLELKRSNTSTLQINVGLLCNQTCRHCHLEAGPHRTEIMARDTMDKVVAYAKRSQFQIVDITGGAPEMNPDLGYLIENIVPVVPRVLLRSNLTVLAERETEELMELCAANQVVIAASFPSTSASQTDSLRGNRVLEKSVAILRWLNEKGYGVEGTGLELNLVSNPAGAFLPASQSSVETKFKNYLRRKWGIVFNNLFTFANVPLGRFLTWLRGSGNLGAYLERLSANFNPCTIDGLMCRSLVSVNWEGYLFDCDFNISAGIFLGNHRQHVSQQPGPPSRGTPIYVGNHCYACTAGSGFT